MVATTRIRLPLGPASLTLALLIACGPVNRRPDAEVHRDGRADQPDGGGRVDGLYEDLDGDGAAEPDDCDDGNRDIRPGAVESCNARDDDCDSAVDEGTGGEESCNGVDDDCDGTADESPAMLMTGYDDDDGDGFGLRSVQACTLPDGVVARGGDCADDDETTHPEAGEACNGRDDDCDGAVDEHPVAGPTFFADGDGDGFGLVEVTRCALEAGVAVRAGDCDDTDASVFPGAPERCDATDNDCDGVIDPSVAYLDVDGDGAGAGPPIRVSGCAPPAGHASVAGDCDDSDPARRPGAGEACNGLDDNCDGDVDIGACPAGCVAAPSTTIGRVLLMCAPMSPWPVARRGCEDLGGTLVALSSNETNASVRSRMLVMGWGRVWTGGNDRAARGTWRWADGASEGPAFWTGGAPIPGEWTRWHPDEPSGATERCLALVAEDGRWRSEDCATPRAYACTIPERR